MKRVIAVAIAGMIAATGGAETTSAPKEAIFEQRPLGITLSIKMVGPYMEPADLQIICAFKHKSGGDTYQGAAKEFDKEVKGVLSSLRNRAEFEGELGETICFTPPQNSIPAKRVVVIGLGDEAKLSLDALRIVGRVAAREAVRQKAKHVAFAPVIRDQGNSSIDVGQSDRAFIEQVLSAYDTERRLQSQGLADEFSIDSWVIEAGPAYFDGAVKEVGEGIQAASSSLKSRTSEPYATGGQP